MHPSNEAFIPEARVGPPRVWTGLVLNDNYKIGSLIEQGSTFELYEGTQISTTELVCLKILLPALAADTRTAAQFLDEARLLGQISHPGLVRYRACARDPQSHLAYVVMDSLGPRLTARLPLRRAKPEDIFELCKRLASALAAAHRSGLIHGHLSPASVVLPGEGFSDAAIIGFSLIKTETSFAFDRAMVDAKYLAPEQLGRDGADNTVGRWTDIYSLALVILATLNGKDACRDFSLLPRKLRPIFTRMLQTNPRRRFRNMDRVVELLDGVVLDSARSGTAIMGSLPRFGRLPLAQMSRLAGAAGRGSLTAAALLIAVSPWLLQTSLPRAPADARAASVVVRAQPSVPTDASAGPAALSNDASANRGLALTPGVVPLPPAEPKTVPSAAVYETENSFVGADEGNRRAAAAKRTGDRSRAQVKSATSAIADGAATRQAANEDRDAEAARTADLNADQVRRLISSSAQPTVENEAAQEDRARQEVAAADQAAVETLSDPAPTAQVISESATQRDSEDPPLLQLQSPQVTDLQAAALIGQSTAAAVKTPDPMDEQAIASRAAAERAKAGAERRLREWCRAQRRRCTFPTTP